MALDKERLSDARRPAEALFEFRFGHKPCADNLFDSAVYTYILLEEYDRLNREAREAETKSAP